MIKTIELNLNELKPYENNPRKNDQAVESVIESIKQCGYIAPIIVDENYTILAGHTRYKALKRLGYKKVDVIVKENLTEEQKKKYRLLDNKTNELAEWDFELLAQEIEGLDFGDLEIDWGVFMEEDDEIDYSNDNAELKEHSNNEKEIECPFCGEKILI